MLWFGAAGSYASAAAARVFGGFFNGIIGSWKCMLGECYDTLAQARWVARGGWQRPRTRRRRPLAAAARAAPLCLGALSRAAPQPRP
jgi:hypothetical protein